MKALIIRSDNTAEVIDTDANLDWLQKTVGGYIEAISARHGDWHAYCNEEGKLLGLPYNKNATLFAKLLGWNADDVLVGTVVFLGNSVSGGETSVPDLVLEEFQHYLGG